MAVRFKDEIMIHPSVYLAPTVKIYGNVKIGACSSIWDGVVIRGDMAAIEIGENTNIQENVVIHVDTDIPTKIGNNVTVGHSAVIHGATIGDNCIIAIKSAILNEAQIGNDSVIGAGSIVMERTVVPSGSVVFGIPGKAVKTTTSEMKDGIHKNAKIYVELGQDYKKRLEEAKYI